MKWDNHHLVGGLEPWNFMTFHILGMSTSQLTKSYFSEGGRYTTKQSFFLRGFNKLDHFAPPDGVVYY